MRTSTRLTGAPHAAPKTEYRSPLRTTLAGADFSRNRPTVVKVQTVSPWCCSSRIVT